jgi:outer membrane biogenesis lipoprotein LolB
MNNKAAGLTIAALAFFVAALAVSFMPGCNPAANQPADKRAEAKHEAHHGGCLNAIETCAVGHAEVKLDGDLMQVWFVGGENQTDKAVRVSDKQILLALTPAGGQERPLTLEPKPNELANEKVGDCSCFQGRADWLAGVKKFTATGKVHHTGRERPIKIVYPEGYDPD